MTAYPDTFAVQFSACYASRRRAPAGPAASVGAAARGRDGL